MGTSEDFNSTTYKILLELVKSQEICKLLYYDDINPLNKPNIVNPVKLIKGTSPNPEAHIFRQPKMPTVEDTGSFVVVSLDDFRIGRDNPISEFAYVNFHFIIHNDCWLIDGGERIYFFKNFLDSIFDNVHLNGIGELRKYRAGRFGVKDNFSGFLVQYENCGFR